MEIIVNINDFINGIVWGLPMIILIVATGIFYTIRLGGVQFVRFGRLFKDTIIKAFKKKDTEKPAKGELTSFQAAMTSVSAIVGSGNIAGVATAIVAGGPGAVFWMIVAALFGMASKFAEIALGIKYRELNPDGTPTGGAMYYLAKGLKARWVGVVFSILVIPFAFVISGIVDSNTIALTLQDYIGIPTLVTGIVLALVAGFIILKGVSGVGYACSLVAPFMGGAYILSGILIIILNIKGVPGAVVEIIQGAFNPRAVTGGAIGSILVVMKNGIARGLFSNEAGLGTSAMIHASAKVNHPVEQAVWGPIEVFLDTILVCTITSLSIVLSGLWSNGELDGASLTVGAFQKTLPGEFGTIISIGCVVLFGFSCLISYYVYAERAIDFLTHGTGNKLILRIVWVLAIVVGSQTTLGFAWDLADTINGLMIIPNLVGLILLSGEVVALKKEYFEKDRLPVHK